MPYWQSYISIDRIGYNTLHAILKLKPSLHIGSKRKHSPCHTGSHTYLSSGSGDNTLRALLEPYLHIGSKQKHSPCHTDSHTNLSTGSGDNTLRAILKPYLHIGASEATVLAILEVLPSSRPALQPLPDVGADGVPGVHVLPPVEQVGPAVVHVLGGPLVAAVLGPVFGFSRQRVIPHLVREN